MLHKRSTSYSFVLYMALYITGLAPWSNTHAKTRKNPTLYESVARCKFNGIIPIVSPYCLPCLSKDDMTPFGSTQGSRSDIDDLLLPSVFSDLLVF